MKIDAPNLNHLWAQLMIEELIRNGVTHFFVAPGSRSSPLALAVAGNPRAQLTVHFDERGLAFAALGSARATGIPAPVITTSGTAVANLFPAVVEASMDHVPMILLTGDRPPELRDCGANQAIDQVKIFDDYTRWFFDIPCPDEKISPRFVLTTIDQAFARARSGPVHLNCQFREPLAPSPISFDRKGVEVALRAWLKSKKPFTCYSSPTQMTTFGCLMEEVLQRKKVRGIIVAGGLQSADEAKAVSALAAESGWPVVADIRAGANESAISCADQLLLSDKFAKQHAPEAVIQFGSRLVSKRLQQWIDKSQPKFYCVVSSGPDRLDAGLTVTHRWSAGISWACKCLRPRLRASGISSWLKSWQKAEELAASAIAEKLGGVVLSEPAIAKAVTNCDATRHLVFASSMPVRDAEMYGARTATPAIANRGASGIDGTVATAAGVAIGSGEPTTLVIGDLALLHDLNSLAMVRETKGPFVIVAINNDGGAIFSFLPVAKHPEHFEKVFGTPHGLSFESAAKMFGLEYAQPTTAKDFESAYRAACTRNGATLIEVRTNREENVRIHREIQDAVCKAVDAVAG